MLSLAPFSCRGVRPTQIALIQVMSLRFNILTLCYPDNVLFETMDEGVRLSSVYAVVMRQRLVCLPVQCVSPGRLLVSQELSKQITEREQANSQLQALFEQSKAESTKLKERLASQEATHNEARKQLQREPRLLALF